MNKEILKLLNDFCLNEYGNELDEVKDTKKIPVMYTEYEKGELEEIDEALKISVFVNVDDMAIFKEINGIEVYGEEYDYNDFIEMLESLDFDAWTNLDELDEYNKLKGEK